MIDGRVFEMFGFFIDRHFLSAADCERIRLEMRDGPFEAAGVVHRGQMTMDRDHRRTQRVGVSDDIYSMVTDRLDAVRDTLERHFGVTLQGLQAPQFLRYEPGHFFHAHADTSSVADAPGYLRDRKISTVMFLGHSTESADRGGDLVFHGLMEDSRLATRGFPFPAAEGTFLAFPSTITHEVTPVTAGQRYSIATWFY
jgi:SM-20-related protein